MLEGRERLSICVHRYFAPSVLVPGPGCIKQFKITWEFLQPFPAFWKFSLHTSIDKSAEGG